MKSGEILLKSHSATRSKQNDLLVLIEEVLKTTGIAPSRFGFEAIGERQLVKQLREGREPREDTRKKILAHIERITTPPSTPTQYQIAMLHSMQTLSKILKKASESADEAATYMGKGNTNAAIGCTIDLTSLLPKANALQQAIMAIAEAEINELSDILPDHLQDNLD